jgi:hypothetical protein
MQGSYHTLYTFHKTLFLFHISEATSGGFSIPRGCSHVNLIVLRPLIFLLVYFAGGSAISQQWNGGVTCISTKVRRTADMKSNNNAEILCLGFATMVSRVLGLCYLGMGFDRQI